MQGKHEHAQYIIGQYVHTYTYNKYIVQVYFTNILKKENKSIIIGYAII